MLSVHRNVVRTYTPRGPRPPSSPRHYSSNSPPRYSYCPTAPRADTGAASPVKPEARAVVIFAHQFSFPTHYEHRFTVATLTNSLDALALRLLGGSSWVPRRRLRECSRTDSFTHLQMHVASSAFHPGGQRRHGDFPRVTRTRAWPFSDETFAWIVDIIADGRAGGHGVIGHRTIQISLSNILSTPALSSRAYSSARPLRRTLSQASSRRPSCTA
ncbi:hypothetical protein HYPSUDRAFT_919242 [Hypholoma sublateritium FD-334 SS-4]|uniref:Uncharacterized protein n=1 Tax=Hypholoma sublateritium (strain FD-334 SS-4) TaxID=945553 RepID=A0A0D2M666_HYPSF|nr:hypothetical protein HYPSUDRAFT_919242 [Hypholoma sublateritium FD-334 SS-4]